MVYFSLTKCILFRVKKYQYTKTFLLLLGTVLIRASAGVDHCNILLEASGFQVSLINLHVKRVAVLNQCGKYYLGIV
jgi:hypothetical protein